MDNIIAFQKWLESDSKPHDEGVLLSFFRKQELLKLFESDPEKAWSYHIKKNKLSNIHPDILINIEDYINDKGDILIYKECECHTNEVKRTLKYKNKNYSAFTWGKRAAITSKKNIPFHAIVLDNKAVIYKKSFATKEEVDEQLAIDANFELNIVKKEESANFNSFSDLETSWTTGNKKLLIIRALFPNETGEVVNLDNFKTVAEDVKKFYQFNSKGKLNLNFEYTDPVQLPNINGTYMFEQILDWAPLVAKDLNSTWNSDNYDFYVVITSNPGQFGYAGRAWIGGSAHHLVNTYAIFRVFAHEFGHNLGLYHASFWVNSFANNKNPAYAGYVMSYGHNFSVMNGKYDPEFYDWTKPVLSPGELEWLGWASESSGDFIIVGANQDKTIKLRPLERNVGPRGIKINKLSRFFNYLVDFYPWVSFRYYFNDYSKDGASVDWMIADYNFSNAFGAVELDMARESGEISNWDRLLKEGRTYLDTDNKIKMSVLKINKDAADPYLEIRIQTDSKIDNTTPPVDPNPPTPPDPEPPTKPTIIDTKIKSIEVKGENTSNGYQEIGLNLLDGKTDTKWLDFNQNTWFKINYTGDVKLSGFFLTSANDESPRDPHTVTLSVSGNKLVEWKNLNWNNRLESKYFDSSNVPAIGNSFTFDLISNASMTQLSSFEGITMPIPEKPVVVIPDDKQYFAVNDSYTDETAPKSNLGQKWELFVKSESKYQRISYLAFNLESYSSNITSAKLYLSTRIDRKDYKKSLTLDIYESATGWKEDKISWVASPTIMSKITNYVLATPDKKVYEIDITDFIKTKIAEKQYEIGFAIKASTPIEYIAKIDAGESAAPPKLVISFK